MKNASRQFPDYDGCNYNPSRVAGKGYYTDDFNGSHFVQGAWRPRLGIARLLGLATINQEVIALVDLRGLTYGLKTIAVEGNGEIVEVDTPNPLWTV